MGLGKWEVVVVTEVFDDVQNYRLACVYNVHSIVLRVCVYYKLVSSSFFFVCMCVHIVCLEYINGLLKRLEPRVLPARCV